MQTAFWWNTTVTGFLFRGYDIHTAGGLVSTCLGLAALGVFFEYLKLMQAQQRQRELFLRARQIRSICPPTESAILLFERGKRGPVKITLCDRVCYIVWDGIIWLNLQLIGYLIMLAVMYYNGWFAVSVILGSGLGYFLFGLRFVKISIQNCQAIRDTFCAMQCGEADHSGETTPALMASTSNVDTNSTRTSACVHAAHA